MAWKKIKKRKDEIREFFKEDEEEKISILDILKYNDDEEELEELKPYISTGELQEIEEEKKAEKRILRIAIIAFCSIGVFFIVFLVVFQYQIQSDLAKYTKPLFEEYYKKTYNDKLGISSIEYICNTSEDCSNIILLTTKNNKHLITIDEKNFGDDIDNKNIYEAYKKDIQSKNQFIQILEHNTKLSYKDYYLNYHYNMPYMDVLPKGVSFEDLKKSKKLTIYDVISYQGNISALSMRNYLQNYSDHSKLFLIKLEKGLPVKVSIVTNKTIFEAEIDASIEKSKGIYYYELDRRVNAIRSLEIQSINASSIETFGSYNIHNAYKIAIEKQYQEKESPSYYFISLPSNQYKASDLVQIIDAGNNSREIQPQEYKELATLTTGGKVYIIGSDTLVFGFKKEKKSFWCNLNLC